MIVEPESIKAIRCSHSGGVSDNHDSRYYGIPTDKGIETVEKKINIIGGIGKNERQNRDRYRVMRGGVLRWSLFSR